MSTPNIIKRLREEKDMTQEDVAKVIGVSKQAVQKYETGASKMGSDKLEKFAKFFDVSPVYVLGYTDDRRFGLEVKEDPYKPVKDLVGMIVEETDINSFDKMSAEMYKTLMDLNEKCLLEFLRREFER